MYKSSSVNVLLCLFSNYCRQSSSRNRRTVQVRPRQFLWVSKTASATAVAIIAHMHLHQWRQRQPPSQPPVAVPSHRRWRPKSNESEAAQARYEQHNLRDSFILTSLTGLNIVSLAEKHRRHPAHWQREQLARISLPRGQRTGKCQANRLQSVIFLQITQPPKDMACIVSLLSNYVRHTDWQWFAYFSHSILWLQSAAEDEIETTYAWYRASPFNFCSHTDYGHCVSRWYGHLDKWLLLVEIETFQIPIMKDQVSMINALSCSMQLKVFGNKRNRETDY